MGSGEPQRTGPAAWRGLARAGYTWSSAERWVWRLPDLLGPSGAPRLCPCIHLFMRQTSTGNLPAAMSPPESWHVTHLSTLLLCPLLSPRLSDPANTPSSAWGVGELGWNSEGSWLSPTGDWLVVFSCEVGFGFRLRITPTLATHGKEDNWGLILCFLETPQGGERFSRP